MELKILFFGDIVGKPGRRAVATVLPQLKEEYQPDLTIANAENLAHGVGVTRKTLDECQKAGVDFFTSGNHIFKKPDVYEIFKDAGAPLIRPANYPDEVPGHGYQTILVGTKSVLVINLNGQVFIEEQFSNPFHAVDAILGEHKKEELAGILVDFHAEATSEKVAFGWYLDGRVSAVIGTHTHVPTADATILPHGTAYLTDVGMVGLKDSVIGVDKNIIVQKFLGQEGLAHDISEHGRCVVNATLISIDPESQKTKKFEKIYREITV